MAGVLLSASPADVQAGWVAYNDHTRGPGTVYLVAGSDTAIWNDGSTVDVYSRHPYYPQGFYTDPASPSFLVMNPAWRGQFRDSFGQPVKFTWWMMGGNIYRDAVNINVPVANTMVLHLMKQYHGAAIRQFGDELSLHYHTFIWSDYNGDGNYFWNQSRTFQECREDFDFTLAQYLLEEDVFPVSFRSGWHYMDNDWQQYLDQLMPFSMHDNWPASRAWYLGEPINNVQDWTRSASGFVPFHPSVGDYQIPGAGKGWNSRSIKMQNMTQADMNGIFAMASNGVDQVVCVWNHLPENFAPNLARIDGLAHTAAANFNGVRFRYCTAVEAMQRWTGSFGTTPPEIDVAENIQGQTVTLTIHTSKPLFQPRPFVALRDAFQQYTNITKLCIASGSNTWTVVLPVPRNALAKIGIAATDSDGNLATRILRYLPDDLYIDNLDPGYAELQGGWISTTNAAWGIDARLALLATNEIAHAQWQLPVSRSGVYRVSVQVPELTNTTGNIMFHFNSGGSNIHSVKLPSAIPSRQWVDIGAPFLDSNLSNSLEMVVSGPAGSFAVADVLRIVPLPDTNLPVILTQPLNSTNFLNDMATFRVVAGSSSPLTYQWRHGAVDLAGETNAMLAIANVSLASAGDYTVVAANSAGITTSAAAALTVVPSVLLPPNRLVIAHTATSFQIWFVGEPGQSYAVQSASDPRSAWTTLDTITAPANGLVGYEVKSHPLMEAYYRLARAVTHQ